MMKLIEYVTVFFAALAGGILALIIAAASMSAPVILYKLQSPAAKSECSRIHSGMDLDDVKAVIKKTPPHREAFSNNTLMFSRDDATCIIKFDPQARKVSEVDLVKHDLKIVE